jgi:hypothetical protein
MLTVFRQCFVSQYVCAEHKLTYTSGGKLLKEKARVILSATHIDRSLFPSTDMGAVTLFLSSFQLQNCDDFSISRANKEL